MANGIDNRKVFEDVLVDEGIKYDTRDEGVPSLAMMYETEHVPSITAIFWFDDDGKTLHFGTGTLTSVPKERRERLLEVVNSANNAYRWLTFYIDNDNDIIASGDAILADDHVGGMCLELLHRMLSICDQAYVTFQKAIWSD